MTLLTSGKPLLDRLIADHCGVLRAASVLTCLSAAELRWRVDSGRWQRPCRGVIVTHSGPLTDEQSLRVALLRWGPRAALAGLTAARIDKLTGFGDKGPIARGPIYLLTPPGSRPRPAPLGLQVVVRQSRLLTDRDIHPLRQPRRTRIARSLIDGAAWMPSDRGAMALLASGVQQGRTRVADLRLMLDRVKPARRRRLMAEILCDIEGGAQALSELDFMRKVIESFGLPVPSRQAGRRDSLGRRRWVDVVFDQWKVMVEIDGAQHMSPLDQWDDMERDNDFTIEGYRVLRFPAWLVRNNPEVVARKILQALRANGYRG